MISSMRNKAVRLDERVFGVQQPALGPFQRRLQEIGGTAPLVFGQYGELSASFEALIDTLAGRGVTKRRDATCWTSGRALPLCRNGSSGSV